MWNGSIDVGSQSWVSLQWACAAASLLVVATSIGDIFSVRCWCFIAAASSGVVAPRANNAVVRGPCAAFRVIGGVHWVVVVMMMMVVCCRNRLHARDGPSAVYGLMKLEEAHVLFRGTATSGSDVGV